MARHTVTSRPSGLYVSWVPARQLTLLIRRLSMRRVFSVPSSRILMMANRGFNGLWTKVRWSTGDNGPSQPLFISSMVESHIFLALPDSSSCLQSHLQTLLFLFSRPSKNFPSSMEAGLFLFVRALVGGISPVIYSPCSRFSGRRASGYAISSIIVFINGTLMFFDGWFGSTPLLQFSFCLSICLLIFLKFEKSFLLFTFVSSSLRHRDSTWFKVAPDKAFSRKKVSRSVFMHSFRCTAYGNPLGTRIGKAFPEG